MPADFPAALPDFAGEIGEAQGATLASPSLVAFSQHVRDEIVALAAELGTLPSGTYATVKDRILGLEDAVEAIANPPTVPPTPGPLSYPTLEDLWAPATTTARGNLSTLVSATNPGAGVSTTVLMQAGTYSMTETIDVTSAPRAGTLVLKAPTPGATVISGNLILRGGRLGIVFDGVRFRGRIRYEGVTNLDFFYCSMSNPSVTSGDHINFLVGGTTARNSDIRYICCDVYDTRNDGWHLSKADKICIRGCLTYDTSAQGTGNHSDVIQCVGVSSHMTLDSFFSGHAHLQYKHESNPGAGVMEVLQANSWFNGSGNYTTTIDNAAYPVSSIPIRLGPDVRWAPLVPPFDAGMLEQRWTSQFGPLNTVSGDEDDAIVGSYSVATPANWPGPPIFARYCPGSPEKVFRALVPHTATARAAYLNSSANTYDALKASLFS